MRSAKWLLALALMALTLQVLPARADEADVEMDGEAMVEEEMDEAGASADGAPQQQQQQGMPREVFEQLLQRSSEKCRNELMELVSAQQRNEPPGDFSEECRTEATGIMMQMRSEAESRMNDLEGGEGGEGGEGAAPRATVVAGDDTTQLLIVLAVVGTLVAGVMIFLGAKYAESARERSANADKIRKEEEQRAKREAKRKRQGKRPVQEED